VGSAIRLAVNPAVLRWARETSGATIEDAAKRLRIPPSAFSRWEAEKASLTLTQARSLASYFKRPLAAFLLPEPPPESAPPSDFRILPGVRDRFDRKTRLAIRKAQRLRSVAKEIMRAMERETSPNLRTATLSDRADQVADGERERLGIAIETQVKWQNEWRAFREWRAALEGQNILVFQFPMPVEDARGFSLSDEEPYAIVVSSSDAVRARIFTLFHEYGHLLLHTPGVCLPRLDRLPRKNEAETERWCNRFAGAFLLPESSLSTNLQVTPRELKGEELYEVLQETARQFKISEQVVLWRLRDLDVISRDAFQIGMERLVARAKRMKRRGGPVTPAKKCVAENGPLFTSLVIEAKGRGILTYSDVSDYLSVRLKHLPEIESSLAVVAA
jgi:Zn-dependent peptidase ImmA (M78 family)/DNA-binding XRE family transcriptional regulator